MKPNELDVFYVIDTETTGFKPAKADAIQVSAVKVRNNSGTYEVLGEFDTFINPEYPLPESIVKFNEKEGTGINDELLSHAPVAKEAAPKIKEFLGDKPVVVLHNAPFDLGFLNKLYEQNLGCPFETSAVVDTLVISKEKVKSKSHKLGDMFELSEKKYSSGNPNFHTSLADAYATLDVLDYLNKTFYSKEEPNKRRFITIGETKPININFRRATEALIKSSFSPDNLSAVICDDRIHSIAVGLDAEGRIDDTNVLVSYSDSKGDLTDEIVELVREQKCSAFMITAKEDKEGSRNGIETAGYVCKGKNEAEAIEYRTYDVPKCKDDLLDLRFEIQDIVKSLCDYTKAAEKKKAAREKKLR